MKFKNITEANKENYEYCVPNASEEEIETLNQLADLMRDVYGNTPEAVIAEMIREDVLVADKKNGNTFFLDDVMNLEAMLREYSEDE